jgi:Nitrile hydratase, alpha chain
MSSTRRDFLATAISVAGAAVTPDLAHAQEHDHGHDHQVVPSDPALRVKALESLLVEKGIVDRSALDAIVDAYENKIGPRNGARVVARAWVDPMPSIDRDSLCLSVCDTLGPARSFRGTGRGRR